MDSNKSDFIAEVAREGIPEHIADWFFDKMRNARIEKPRAQTPSNLDPDDHYQFIVDGTVELCAFRPTLEDIKAASENQRLETFLSLAKVITSMCAHGPKVGDSVVRICESGSSSITQQLWQALCELPRNGYNDQFAIKCYVNKTVIAHVGEPSGLLNRCIANVQSFMRLNSSNLESFLKRKGYHFESVTDLKSFRATAGDVIKIQKEPWHDRFTAFALVSEVENEVTSKIEFKLPFNSPLRATLEGFELFFFRDKETKLVGVWRAPTSSDRS